MNDLIDKDNNEKIENEDGYIFENEEDENDNNLKIELKPIQTEDNQ